jgi:hypothetical protein
MFGDQNDTQNNLKDTSGNQGSNPLGISLKDKSLPLSYTKATKLITALYMVTDIMDKDEPLRNKLRTLGANILSDTFSNPAAALAKIGEVMSFLDVAGAMNIISQMNSGILRKEFTLLGESIREYMDSIGAKPRTSEIDISELFTGDQGGANNFSQTLPANRPAYLARPGMNRIGVQRGGTLLKAMSDNISKMSDTKKQLKQSENFDVLKKERRYEIVSFITRNGGSATITDIRAKATGALANMGEKTLQRELLNMLKDGVLKKTGEKRWSRYYIA